MQVGVTYARYEGEARGAFLRELTERLSALPAVESATVGNDVPMMGLNWSSIFTVDDRFAHVDGANRSSIFALVLRQGMTGAALGAAIGVASAFALARVLGGWLYGVAPTDPLTFVSVPLVLLSVSFVACAAPAFMASRIEPTTALRYE